MTKEETGFVIRFNPDAEPVRLTEREARLITNCKIYEANDPAGLPGHNLMLIIAKIMKEHGVFKIPPSPLRQEI